MAPKKKSKKKAAKKPAKKLAKKTSKKRPRKKKVAPKKAARSSRKQSSGAALRAKHAAAGHDHAANLGEWPEGSGEIEAAPEFSEDDIPPDYGGSE